MSEQKDYFALLEVPRRALLDADLLKLRYHAVTKKTHPDVSLPSSEQEADSAEINAAYSCLLQPSTRLRHLLSLIAPEEVGQLKGGAIPDAFIDIFSRLATAVQGADALIVKKKTTTSALAQALLTGEEMKAREDLEAAGAMVAEQRIALETGALPAIDIALDALVNKPDSVVAASIASKIAEAFRAFGFLDKWQAQVRSKLLELFESGN